jgi:hypothetical protein
MSSPDQPTPPSGWGDAPRPPAYGQYGPGQYGAGQYGTGQQPGTALPGTPPPNPYGPSAHKPGIVPLRPLSLGEIYDGAFTAVRHNPRVMLGIVTLIVVVGTVLAAVLAQFIVPWIAPFVSVEVTSDPLLAEIYGSDAGAIAQLFALGLTLSLTLLVVQPFSEGLVTLSVSQSVIGRRLSPGEVWARFRPRAGVLVLWTVLRAVVSVVGMTLLFFGGILLIVAVAQVSGSVGATLAVALVTLLAAVALAAWLVVRTVLVTPALALERAGLVTTFGRAWRLTRQNFWRILGTYLLATIIAGLAGQAVSVPLGFVGIAVDGGVPGWATVTLAMVSTVVAYVIVFVFVSGVVALIYTDIRMRREGLDVRLAEAAARASAGPGGGTGAQPPTAPGPLR